MEKAILYLSKLDTVAKADIWCQLNRMKAVPEVGVITEGVYGGPNSLRSQVMNYIENEIGDKETSRQWHLTECGHTNEEFEEWYKDKPNLELDDVDIAILAALFHEATEMGKIINPSDN